MSKGAVSEEGVEAVRLMAGGKSKARGTSACVAERPNPAKPERPDGHPSEKLARPSPFSFSGKGWAPPR